MPNMLSRLCQLSGLREDEYLSGEDLDDQADHARYDREAKVKKLIEIAFEKIGLSIDFDGILYDEQSDREAHVMLMESSIDITDLEKLKATGLSDRYQVHGAGAGELQIIFSVSPALDSVRWKR